jgi:16S rRNA (guanine527-N7)-methyltransferase
VKHPDPRLRAYCDLVVSEPTSVTAIRDRERAWAVLVEDALAAAEIVGRLGAAEAVDVGSGGGSPGIPLAIALRLPTTLLEATGTKCRFLERAVAATGAPCAVVHARSEEYAREAGRDRFPLALARALAPPPVAAELVLPLVPAGGAAILWTGAAVDIGAVAETAALVGGGVEAVHDVAQGRRLVVLRKHQPTPERFPRRPGIARARPLVRVPSLPA